MIQSHITDMTSYISDTILFKQLVDIVPSFSARQVIEPSALGLNTLVWQS
jgi:hypothetical protein